MKGSYPRAGLLAVAFALIGLPAFAQDHGAAEPPSVSWSWNGVFGAYDQAQIQRGFQVYREVCASCHSLDYVALRNLGDADGPGYSEGQVRTVAAEYQIEDGPDESGAMFERPGLPSDYFPAPFANEQAARAANGGALPPDLSVIAKARPGGADYLHALLTGYTEPPEGTELAPGQYWNEYFPGHLIGMPPPLNDEQVLYTDGSPQTAEQYSTDVSAFMMWAAEPHMTARKSMGFAVMMFLLAFGGLLYFTKRKVWSALEH